MPIPLVLAALAGAAGVKGVTSLAGAAKKRSRAKDIIEAAREEYGYAQKEMEGARFFATQTLDALGETKVDAWAHTVGRWLKLFRRFKNVKIKDVPLGDVKLTKNVSAETLKDMEVASMKATEVLQGGIGTLGAGALTGIAAYGGTMMFATASTGTAIATLSGAAASNAALAWLGGGSLAAGGLGMAGGALVLGGIVLGPALAVAGILSASKADEALAKAERDAAEAHAACAKLDTVTAFLNHVQTIASQYNDFVFDFAMACDDANDALSDVYRAAAKQQKLTPGELADFTRLTEKQKGELHLSWLLIQVLYQVLKAPLLTEQGELAPEAEKTLAGAKTASEKLLGEAV